MIQKAPISLKTGWFCKVSLDIANKPKTAKIPYTKSAIATPKPVKKPALKPYWIERLMHNTAAAPTGRATKNPTIRPANKYVIKFSKKVVLIC